LITTYSEELKSLKGKVDLIAGGPPCQGFSLAGQRNENDPRNKLSEEYIKMVKVISPKYLLLENVRGFNSSFKNKRMVKLKKPYSLIVKAKLENSAIKFFIILFVVLILVSRKKNSIHYDWHQKRVAIFTRRF
jgi:DNA (cytosine-5)-methyltransferase 1